MNATDTLKVLAFIGVLTLYLVWSAKTEMGTKQFKKK
jgi:hypothetical protein